MNKVIGYFLAILGLALTLLPALLVFVGKMEFETHKMLMTVGMVCWFLGVVRLVKR